jgi:hypothetical protein
MLKYLAYLSIYILLFLLMYTKEAYDRDIFCDHKLINLNSGTTAGGVFHHRERKYSTTLGKTYVHAKEPFARHL